MDQFCILRCHDVKFGENRITFDPSPHIKSNFKIHVYIYKWLKNIGITMKFGMNVYFVNLNAIINACYSWSTIACRSSIGSLKKICLAITIAFKNIITSIKLDMNMFNMNVNQFLLCSDHKCPYVPHTVH